MRAREINPAKIKIFFEQGPLIAENEARSNEELPEVRKISGQQLLFDKEISLRQVQSIKKIIVLVYILGRWKEYTSSQYYLERLETKEIEQVGHKGQAIADFVESSKSLAIVIDEKNGRAFKNDLLMVLR